VDEDYIITQAGRSGISIECMKYGIAAIVLIIVVGVIVIGSRRKTSQPQSENAGNPYHDLRNQVLQLDARSAGIQPTRGAGVWGVLMETGYPEATVTLVALLDGTASLYFENGGGIIGGGDHESLSRAATAMASAADGFIQYCSKTDTFPLPETDDTTFYILTTSGIFTFSAKEEELGENRQSLSPLFHAGHEVIGQLGMIEGRR